MSLSIRSRIILAMNLLVVGVGLAVGWAGVAVAGRAIEHRLVDQAAANAAGLFATMRLPLSNGLMDRLKQILGAEVAAVPVGATDVAAASLPDREAAELGRCLADPVVPRVVVLGGKRYFLGRADTVQIGPAAAAASAVRLYLLVPEAQVDEAKHAAQGTILGVMLAAVAAATLLGSWLSWTITRPVRRLAERMDRMCEEAAAGKRLADGPAAAPRGPVELARLQRSFDELLRGLESTREQLARSARLATLGQLSASVVHELRNPLSGIQMNARVLSDELARAGVSDRSLEHIIREIERMDLFLEEVLSLAADAPAAAGADGAAAWAPVRLDELTASALRLVEGRLRHAGVAVENRLDQEATAVRGDALRLRQVILNLVLNALDAMPDGGTLRLAAEPRDGGLVRYSVADTGPGVRAADGEDIFDPFVTTKPRGVGLGLHICRLNVHRLGGRIGYDSGPGGATFWFELPRAD